MLDTAKVVSLLAKSGKTNGTRSGESNSKISVLIGGANAFASSTTDGTGQLTRLSYLPTVCSVSLWAEKVLLRLSGIPHVV